MKTLIQSESKHLTVDNRLAGISQLGWIILLIGSAAFVGWNVAHETWIVLLAVATVPLALRWPVQVGLGAFALLVPFDYISSLGEKASGRTLTWFVSAFAAVLLLGIGLVRQHLIRPPAAVLWWSLFVSWGGASILWAIEPQAVLERLPTALGLLALFLAATCVRISRSELQCVAMLAITGGLAASAFVCSQFYSGIFYKLSTRASLVTSERKVDPNVFAAMLLLPMSLAMSQFVSPGSRLRRTAMLGTFAVIGFAVFLTMSRGAILAICAMVIVFLYRLRAKARLLIPTSILLLALMLVPNLLSRFQEAGATGGSGRLDIWIVGLVSLKRYGLMGAGLENFPYAFKEFVGYQPVFHGFYFQAAHNIYVQISVELGVVGMVTMIGALVSQLRAVKRLYARIGRSLALDVLPYEAACWGLLVAGFFLGVIWLKGFWLSWILLAVATRIGDSASGLAPSMGEISRRSIPNIFSGLAPQRIKFRSQ